MTQNNTLQNYLSYIKKLQSISYIMSTSKITILKIDKLFFESSSNVFLAFYQDNFK